jgi:ABC-type hemin transport system substrate-binding protein
MRGLWFVLGLVLGGTWLPTAALADDKAQGPSCQDQLNESKVHAYNLDQNRDSAERLLAKSQAVAYALQQRVAQLEKMIADMKKGAETKPETKTDQSK